MVKTLETAVSTQVVASQRQPAILFEMGMESGTTLYWTSLRQDVTFPSGATGQVYTARAIKMDSFTQSAEGQINRISIKIDNVDKAMTTYAEQYNLEGKPIIIKRVYLGDVGNEPNYNELFFGTMEQPMDMDRFWFPVNATFGRPLYDQALLPYYSRNCRHDFGGKYCIVDDLSDLTSAAGLLSNSASAAIDTAGTTWLTMPTPDVSGVTGTNDDAFNYGLVQVGKSGVTHNRICTDYDSGTSKVTWTVGLPVLPDNTYRFQVFKGCDKLWDTCSGAYAYGPVGNNTDNFGGFLHIGDNE